MMGYVPPKEEIETLIDLLESDGFIVEGDTSLPISVTGAISSLADILAVAGWTGKLVGAATEHGGEWPYWCYDANKLEPSEAKAQAIKKWNELHSNKVVGDV